MAACTKVAAFGALLRVLLRRASTGRGWDFTPVLGAVAMLTMLVGAVLAVTQTDIKRLLAYSSIANAGYLLVGVLGARARTGSPASMFYLVAYGFSVIAAFAVVTLVRDADGEATHLSRWAGLGRRSPLFAGDLHVPPARLRRYPADQRVHQQVRGLRGGARTGGPDLAGHRRRGHQHDPGLPVPAGRGDDVALRAGRDHARRSPMPGALTSAALMIGVLATLVLGVAPAPLLDLANGAAEFVR